MKDVLTSIADIDTMLDKEFEESPETVVEESEVVEENPQEETVEQNKSQEKPVEEESEPKEPVRKQDFTKEQQQMHSFTQLKKEKSMAEHRASGYESLISDLAQLQGYPDIESYISALNQAINEKKAANQGMNPEVYEKIQSQENAIKQIQQERAQQEYYIRFNTFKNTVDSVVEEYNLSQDDVQDMFGVLENEGYNLNMLLSVPNSRSLIVGALSDKIQKQNIQKTLAKEKLGIDDEAHTSASTPVYDEDEEIAREVAEWGRSQGYRVN